MVDRKDRPGLLHCLLHRGDIEGARRADAEIDPAIEADRIGMAAKGGDLGPGDQQDVVIIGLELAQPCEMRDGVVIGDRDEIEAGTRGGVDGAEERARHLPARLAGAAAVRMGIVHVEIAAEPAGPGPDRAVGNRGAGVADGTAIEEDLDPIGAARILAGIGHAELDVPAARGQRAGEIAGRGVAGRDGETVARAAAPAAEALGIEQAEIDDRPVRLVIAEAHGDAPGPVGHVEGDLLVGLVIRAGDLAGHHLVRLLRICGRVDEEEAERDQQAEHGAIPWRRTVRGIRNGEIGREMGEEEDTPPLPPALRTRSRPRSGCCGPRSGGR